MAKQRPSGPAEPEATFEQAMSELEEIVHVLEDSRLPLDELVERYERGAGLLRVCQARLQAAQQRIELITRGGSEPPALEPFASSGAEPLAPAPQKPAARKPASSDHADTDEIRLFQL